MPGNRVSSGTLLGSGVNTQGFSQNQLVGEEAPGNPKSEEEGVSHAQGAQDAFQAA